MSKDKKHKNDPTMTTEQENVPNPETLQEDDIPSPEETVAIDLEKLQTELENSRKQSEEYLNMAQRVQADFDNYRRRNNSARAEAFDEGAVALAKMLLPVLDNMERALDASANSPDTALKEGVAMVHRQLCEAFEKRGIETINRLNEKFDPSLENAVLTAPRDEGEPGTVCEVFQKGYKLDKIVLRHAMVKVVEE